MTHYEKIRRYAGLSGKRRLTPAEEKEARSLRRYLDRWLKAEAFA